MGRPVATADDLAAAYSILFGGETFTTFDENLYAHYINQEEAVIKREAFEKELTKDAQEIINIILTCSDEIVGSISWNKIVKFLCKKGWTDYRLRRIKKEIKEFLRGL